MLKVRLIPTWFPGFTFQRSAREWRKLHMDVVEGPYNANGVPETQLANALGIYLAAWFIFTFIMLLASFRSSVGLVALFFFLDITFLLLFVSEFTGNSKIQTAGGAFGILTAAIAWYVGAAGLLTPDTSYFTLPVIELSRRD